MNLGVDVEQEGTGVPQVFLMTDVVGSTGQWERHEREMPAVLARHDEVVHGAVAGAGGRVAAGALGSPRVSHGATPMRGTT